APLNPAYKAEEFRFYMEDASVRAVIAPPGDHPVREAARALNLQVWEARLAAQGQVRLEGLGSAGASASSTPPQPDDVALVLTTSATTSRPKGVPLTHRTLTTPIRNIVATYGLTPADTSFIVMPLFHVHGLLGATLSTLHSGGTVVVPPRFSAGSFWEQ